MLAFLHPQDDMIQFLLEQKGLDVHALDIVWFLTSPYAHERFCHWISMSCLPGVDLYM